MICFALLYCAAPAACSTTYGQEFPYAAQVAADGLPVHAGPLADDYVTTTLPRGTQVTVVRHDPDGRAMIQAPSGAVSFAKLEWLTMTAGTAEGGGTATVTATGNELYCRVGSRVGEAPMIEQVPLKTGQAIAVQGTRSLPGPNGPEVWAQIPSPKGEHRWVQRRYLLPANAQARADLDRDPYAVPSDLLDAGAPVPGGGTVAQTDPFAPAPADATGSGVVEVAFAAPHPLQGGSNASPLLAAADPPSASGLQTASADPFSQLGSPAMPMGQSAFPSGTSADRSQDGPRDPSHADRFAAHGAAAVEADRRRLTELDRRMDKLLDADPQSWNLVDLEADLRDLRDRASSNAVRRLAQARLVRIDVLKSIRGEYSEYVELTERTDQRDARLTVEASEMLRRFAQVEEPYGIAPYGPQTAEGFPMHAPAPRTAAGPGGFDPYGDTPSLAAPPSGGIDQLSHSEPAGGPAPADAPPGAMVFEAVGVLREVTNPPHPQAPKFALVAADGRVAAYLKDDPRLGLAGRVGQNFGVNGRRFSHPDIAAPMVAVTRLTPVRK
ncbi:hypothetical protein [Alienimonas chondri]|uniref:hypothetical protein n=1 Tax=Alienimonas chondri TaxID=2681879 RepID=UPI001489D633|nr:hypothetical protein [Alienimonas chondri]